MNELKFAELPRHWQRIFELEWESVCKGSKAIAAVITDTDGRILSEGRNRIGENSIPNPAAAHAETEAVRSLDTAKYPDPHSYILYAGLEPCVMCMGTMVMGRLRHCEIAARDLYGGAISLMQHSAFIRDRNVEVRYADTRLGEMQRAFQTVQTLLFEQNADKRRRMLTDFAVCHRAGAEAAERLVRDGYFREKQPADYTADIIFDTVMHNMAQAL